MAVLGDMDCGSRGLTTQWPLQLSEPQGAPPKIRRLQGPGATAWWLVPYTRHFSTWHRMRMQTELERNTHKRGKGKPPATNSVHSSPSSGPSWGWTGGWLSSSQSGASGPGTWHPGASLPVGQTGTSGPEGPRCEDSWVRQVLARPARPRGQQGRGTLWEGRGPTPLGDQRLAQLPERLESFKYCRAPHSPPPPPFATCSKPRKRK